MHIKTLLVFAIALSTSISTVLATDGYFSVGYGAKHKGVAGAGIAMYHYSLVNGNPAGLALLGKQYEIGVSLFNPNREYTISGAPSGIPNTFGLVPGTTTSDSKLFFIPRLAGNWVLNDKSSFSVSIFGNGGMNTDYPKQVFYDPSSETTGVNLSQLFTNISYSIQVAEGHSFGVTAVVAAQFFEAKGVTSFANFSSDASKLSGNGSDSSFGLGLKLGYMGQLSDALSIGVVYQSKTSMSEFDEYAGLFAEQGDFDVPSSFTAGIAYNLSDKLTAMADVKMIYYSGVNSVGNPIDASALPPANLNPGGDPNNPMDYTPNSGHVPLGDDSGSGFGWEDMTIFKIGLSYDVNEKLTLRGGFSHGNNPIGTTEALFNILAPGTIEDHIALGLSTKMANGSTLDFSFNYALGSQVSGPNPFDFDPVQAGMNNFVPNQDIELDMNQIDFSIGYTF